MIPQRLLRPKRLLWLCAVLLFILASFFQFNMLYSLRVYCSPIRGQILLDGKPVSGLKLERSVASDGLPGGRFEDFATTDSEGKFYFPVIQNRTFFKPDFFNTSGSKPTITLKGYYENWRYFLWHFRKGNYERGSETGSKNIELKCDLLNIKDEFASDGLRILNCSIT